MPGRNMPSSAARTFSTKANLMNDHVALREFILEILKEKDRRLVDLRIEDHRRIDQAVVSLRERFEQSIADVDKASRLLFAQNAEHFEKLNHSHEEAQRILGTYALLRDFNELKSKVDLTISEISSRLKFLDEGKINHEQRLRNIEEIQPPVASRLKDLETQGASREERLRGIETIEAGRSSLSKDEKARLTATIQRVQIFAGIAALVSVGVAILNYVK